MIKEAIDRILELKRPETIEIECDDGELRTWKIDGYHAVMVPRCVPLEIHELAGIARCSKGVFVHDNGLIIHIEDYSKVSLISSHIDRWGRREKFAECNMFKRDEFRFGYTFDIEALIINLRSKFVFDDELEKVLIFVSSITQSNSTQASDDGVSQTVVTKNSIGRGEKSEFDGRCKLRPYRTFSEVEQPQIECYLRLTQVKDSLPNVTIYEADGGGWRNKAIENIKTWLSERVKDVDIIG